MSYFWLELSQLSTRPKNKLEILEWFDCTDILSNLKYAAKENRKKSLGTDK